MQRAQYYYNQYRYYQQEIQMDWRIVVSLFLAVISVSQYYYWKTNFDVTLKAVKNTVQYKNKVKALEYELSTQVRFLPFCPSRLSYVALPTSLKSRIQPMLADSQGSGL